QIQKNPNRGVAYAPPPAHGRRRQPRPDPARRLRWTPRRRRSRRVLPRSRHQTPFSTGRSPTTRASGLTCPRGLATLRRMSNGDHDGASDPLRAALETLEAIVGDRGLLQELSLEERTRLLSAAGSIFNPDIAERRRSAKALRRRDKAAK